jgi:hypothetical protein
LDSVTKEEKDLLHRLIKDEKFFCEFLSGKEKVTFWIYKLMRKIKIK